MDTKKLLVRRSIDQLGFIKDVNSLVVLSGASASTLYSRTFLNDRLIEMNVSLFPLPSFKPPTVLANAKAAFSFAIHTSLQHITQEPSKSQQEFSKPQSIPTVVTLLLVGCRRKTVIYSWRDGEPQEVRVCLFHQMYLSHFCLASFRKHLCRTPHDPSSSSIMTLPASHTPQLSLQCSPSQQ